MTDTPTALAIRRPAAIVSGYQPPPSEEEFRGMIYMAKQLAEAQGFVPDHFYKQPFKIVAAILYGRDLGISPTNALQHIIVIDGKAGADAQLIGMLVRRAGHDLKDVTTNEGSTVTIKRGDTGTVYEATFTKADAERITIRTKDGYKKLAEQPAYKNYPRGMYYSRALTECARKGAQDALMGVAYTPEELGVEVAPEGGFTGEIPTSQASPASVAALEGEIVSSQGASTPTTAVATHAVGPVESASGSVEPPSAEVNSGAAEKTDSGSVAPPPAAPSEDARSSIQPPPQGATGRSARSVGPKPKRTNVIPAPQGPQMPATAPEPAPAPTVSEEPVSGQDAPAGLTDEPVAAEPVDEGKAVYLGQQRELLRQAAANLFRVNVLLRNPNHALKGEDLEAVPPPTPNEASDEGLRVLIDRDFPGRTLADLDEAQLQGRLELLEANLAAKRKVMAEKGIAE